MPSMISENLLIVGLAKGFTRVPNATKKIPEISTIIDFIPTI